MTRTLMVTAAGSLTGGGEKHVADLLALLDRTIKTAVACPPGSDLAALAERRNIATFAVDFQRGVSPRQLLALRRAIRSWAPDIVHAHGTRTALFVRLACPHARRRVVYTVHGFHLDQRGPWLRRKVLMLVERLVARRTAAWIAVSDATAHVLIDSGLADPARCTTVHNGVDVEAIAVECDRLRQPHDGIVVMHIARMAQPKDHATLLKAWAELRPTHPEARLVLTGNGPDRDAILADIDAFGLSGVVEVEAPQAGITPMLARADLLALSTLREGLPYVVIEAMAAGVPVVATAVGGIPEAVDDGVTGLLVPPGDAPALAAALGRLMGDVAERRRFGTAGRAVAGRGFSIEVMTTGVEDVYRRVISAQRPPRGHSDR